MIHTILIYVFAYLISISMFVYPKIIAATLTSRQALFLYIHAAVILFALTFNIGYTAMLGWNDFPKTVLELILDSITGILYLIGLVGYYYILHIAKQQQRRIVKKTIGF